MERDSKEAELAHALEAADGVDERAEAWHCYLTAVGADIEDAAREAARLAHSGSNAELVEFANRHVPAQAAAERASIRSPGRGTPGSSR